MPAQQETVYQWALTTLARVKDRLDITLPDFDLKLIRTINAATDLIERECGKTGLETYPNDGHFIQKTYTNEVYSAAGRKQIYLNLRNAPVTYLIVSGNLTQGSATVANCSTTVGVVAGMLLYNIQGLFPQGTTVLSATSNSITMSQPASVSQNGAVFEISGLLKFQWRAGTPSNPNWTDFITDQFELKDQGRPGIVRVYGAIPGLYNNMLRATYVAGYTIDWQNAGNGTTHQLPADLSNTCESIVERIFKRRGLAGKTSESLQGATIAFRNDLDQMDLDTIARYKRFANIF
jgi:hypothetical protein